LDSQNPAIRSRRFCTEDCVNAHIHTSETVDCRGIFPRTVCASMTVP
jgi:hypothetical protein